MEQYTGNPVDLKEYDKLNLRVSTTFRSSEASPHTKCKILFGNTDLGISRAKRIDITGASIPNNFCNVSSYCNKYVLEVYNDPTLDAYTLTIPPNYYNATQLATIIENQIKVYVPTATFFFNTDLKRFQYNSNSSTAIALQVDTDQISQNSSYNNLMWILGETFGTGLNDTLFTFTNEPNLVGVSTVYILSNKIIHIFIFYT